MSDIRYFSLGDSALTVEFGNSISAEFNQAAVALSDYLTRKPFPGYIESVPAYTSTTIFYDISEVRRNFSTFPNAFSAVSNIAKAAVSELDISTPKKSRTVEIPVRFDAESGPDLEIVAHKGGLTSDAVIDIFTGTIYRVFMLGFLPGFAYMGEVDDRIATLRKSTPRSHVPAGSVGIAGKQTGIYSLDSPGGWQIIGRTDLEMFSPDEDSPCLLRPGDEVRFVQSEK